MSESVAVSPYVPGPVERFGRRIKLEYVGMVSVYLIVALLVFGGGAAWWHGVLGAIGSFFLFLGLKKKTRDHLSGSLVLLAATIVARPAVVGSGWALPFLLAAAAVCALEGYVEKRQEQVYALPLVFLAWGFLDWLWIPALALAALYLAHPWAERPGLRRRLGWIVAGSLAAALVGPLAGSGPPLAPLTSVWSERQPLDTMGLVALAALGLPALLCVALHWRRLIAPHRWAPLLFAPLAAWDVRLAALAAMVAAVALTATVFRLSIDSDRLRPWFKHAEWHYFWYVFALALWALAVRVVPGG
ncbi:MAG: hypothetical protein KJ058_12415 [Thermoanaerobaculia bacterium]|nr:hypothetical protein [Thermoanaerobaculia bacterium]